MGIFFHDLEIWGFFLPVVESERVFSSYPYRGMGTIVRNLGIVYFHGAGGYSD